MSARMTCPTAGGLWPSHMTLPRCHRFSRRWLGPDRPCIEPPAPPEPLRSSETLTNARAFGDRLSSRESGDSWSDGHAFCSVSILWEGVTLRGPWGGSLATPLRVGAVRLVRTALNAERDLSHSTTARSDSPTMPAASATCWPPRFSGYLPTRGSIAALQSGAHMDSGRFNFWRLLLYTRAITPPRVPAGLWPGSVFPRRGAWSLLLLVAVLAAGVSWRLNQREPPVQASAVSPPPTNAPVGPAPRAPRW
jgi:hypothetical protein